MARVWGTRPDEAELEWLYERNPLRPASVLLAEEDGRVAGTVAISFQPLGDGVAGFAIQLATDPAYRGRGIFSALQAENEDRARAAGVSLLLTVPTAASARVLAGRLGWKALPSLRVWARPWLPAQVHAARVDRFDDAVINSHFLNWRFADAPRDYRLFADGTVIGRRARLSFVARGRPDVASLTLQGSFRSGFLPTPKTFTVLGKSLDGSALPARVELEFGDLDFM
jgi:GNAT superfamily N-acetyltransferase